jgi:hypothetical protein
MVKNVNILGTLARQMMLNGVAGRTLSAPISSSEIDPDNWINKLPAIITNQVVPQNRAGLALPRLGPTKIIMKRAKANTNLSQPKSSF